MGTEPTNVVVVMVSAPNQEEAAKIADLAVRSRLAACASTVPTMSSTYWWEGKIANEQEALILMKTTSDKVSSLQEAIRTIHSYKVPEILAIQVESGFLPYLEWVHREVS
jgi:periplasmic divalent cation tolerance protein